jgi:integrase
MRLLGVSSINNNRKAASTAVAASTVDTSRDDFLVIGAYASSTNKRYRDAANGFIQWANVKANIERLSSWYDYDDALFKYFHYLYRMGKGKALADATFYGLCMICPRVKAFLLSSRLALRGYHRLQPTTPWLPMPWHIAILISCWFARRGRAHYGIGTLLAFDGYLRINELVNLHVNDFAFGTDRRFGNLKDRLFINIRKAKTGVWQGVEILDPHVRQLIKCLIESINRNGDPRIFPFTDDQYRRALAVACRSLELPHYVPHSLRHGGATRDYVEGIRVEDIMARGRWAVTKTARRYIQQSRQLLMLADIPQTCSDTGEILRKDICGWFLHYLNKGLLHNLRR